MMDDDMSSLRRPFMMFHTKPRSPAPQNPEQLESSHPRSVWVTT